MRLTPWTVAGLALAAALALAIVVLDSTAPASCADADASVKAGLVGHADKAYAKILGDEPKSTCAKDGMMAVTAELCKRATQLRTTGPADEADKAYVSLLTHDPPPGDTCHAAAPKSDDPDEQGEEKGSSGGAGGTVRQALTIVLCVTEEQCRWAG